METFSSSPTRLCNALKNIPLERLPSMNDAFVRSCGGSNDILALINKHGNEVKE
jgi:hypothetical protein